MTSPDIGDLVRELRQHASSMLRPAGASDGGTFVISSAGPPILATLRQAADALERLEAEKVICAGCGSTMTAADLAKLKAEDPRVLSCCPERKPLTILEWFARCAAAEAQLAEIGRLANEVERCEHGTMLIDIAKAIRSRVG